MARQICIPRTPDTKFSSSMEIVRGSSLPPGVEDEIKGELYFHVHSIEWEQTFKPPPTCSLILHWWGLPAEEFAILAIPSLDYRPPDVTAIFPLRSGQKHLRRYFSDMGSLELVVVRDKKTWNGYEQAGTRVGTSNLLLQDLDDTHFINASCFLYDEAQRLLGTLYIQVQVHYKTRYRKQLPKPVRGCRKVIKTNHNKIKAEGSSFSNLNVDALLNPCERKSWGLSCDAFAERLHDSTNSQHQIGKHICVHLESLEKDNHSGLLTGDWASPHVQLTLPHRGGESAPGVRSASFSDFRALGMEAALETAYLQGIDQETAEMVSRIGRKQIDVHNGGIRSPGKKCFGSWSNANTEEILTPNCSRTLITEGEAETSMSQEESTLHRDKKAKQNEQLPRLSAEDISMVLNRWFGNAAAPSSKALTSALQDNRNILDEKLDQLISDMKKGDSWTSTPGSPTSEQGESGPQNGNDQVTSFQEMFPAKVRQLEATEKCKPWNEHHLQKRRRNRSPEKGYKRNPGIQVNLGSAEQNGTSIAPGTAGQTGQELSCASESGSMACASQKGQISEEIGSKWRSDCVGAQGNRYTSAPTKDCKFFSRMLPSQEGGRQEQEPHLHSNGIGRQTTMTLKSKPEALRQQESEVDSLSRIIGRAAALRDALAQGSFKPRGSSLPQSKKVDVLACGNYQPKHRTQDSKPGYRPCISRDGQKEPGNTGTHHGLLATVLRNLHEERPPYEGERTDSAFVDRILRFTNANIFLDGQEDPREVAEEALLKELFFPGQQESTDQKTYNVIQEIGCNNSEALAVERAGHNMHSSQGPLCLAISVENLILLDAYARDLTSCKCLLTLCFPAVKLLVADTKTSPEQVVSISPVARRQRELVFEHQSQSHWQLPSGESGVDTWRSQIVRVNVSFKWPSSDVVRCEGSIPLERVVQSMPLAYVTDLQLIKVKEFTKTPWNGNTSLPRTTQKSEARATSNWLKVLGDRNGHCHKKPSKKPTSSPPPVSSSESRPKLYATVRIGLRLLADSDQQPKPGVKGLPQQPREVLDEKATQSAKQVAQTDFSWFYVSVDYFYDFQSINDDETLDLVIKLSTDTVTRTPFSAPVYKQDPLKGGYTARQNADAVIRSSTSIKTPIIFVEIWRTSFQLKKDGLEHLIGIIRVPLLSSNNSDTVAAAELYPVYNPVKDYACGDANVVVMRGLKSEMFKLQKENHASPKSLCGNLEEARAEGSGTSTTAGQPVNSSNHCAMTRHVFEVKVQELLGLPAARILGFSRCSPTGGGFIKYLFPGEKEALFTQEVKWNQHMSFQASVRHVISLPAGEDLREHLESGGSNNLRFELWGYCSKFWGYEPEVVQALENLNIDMRSKSLTGKGSIPNLDPGDEQHMGTAVLPLQKMFDLLKEWRRAGSTGEVKKAFRIPFTLVEELQDMGSEVPTVTVQLAYERSQARQQENLLADTIFADKGLMGVVDGHSLEVSLEINIIRATSLQSAINAVLLLNTSLSEAFVDGVNSYVQFSPFPCNAKLEETYPPTSTPFKEKELVPNYSWTKYMSLLLDCRVLKELRTKDMTFEVWHSSTHSTHKDIWLGTASAPCLPLLQNGGGVNGWLDLLSRKGEIVGALQVAVCFTGWR